MGGWRSRTEYHDLRVTPFAASLPAAGKTNTKCEAPARHATDEHMLFLAGASHLVSVLALSYVLDCGFETLFIVDVTAAASLGPPVLTHGFA